MREKPEEPRASWKPAGILRASNPISRKQAQAKALGRLLPEPSPHWLAPLSPLAAALSRSCLSGSGSRSFVGQPPGAGATAASGRPAGPARLLLPPLPAPGLPRPAGCGGKADAVAAELSRASPYLEAAAQAAAFAAAPLSGGGSGAWSRVGSPPSRARRRQRGEAAAAAAAGRGRRAPAPPWDPSPTLLHEASFEEALAAWRAAVDAGAFALRPVSALARAPPSPPLRPRPPPLTAPAQGEAATSTAAPAGSSTGTGGSLGHRITSGPVVFSGGDAPALDALEELLLRTLLHRPRLTPLQLRAATAALRGLDAAPQLAAAALLLRGGFWGAAMGLNYGGDLALASDALSEVAALLRAGLALDGDDEAAAASWRWHPCDRELFFLSCRMAAAGSTKGGGGNSGGGGGGGGGGGDGGLAAAFAALRRALARAPWPAAAAAIARAERALLLEVAEAMQERVWAAADEAEASEAAGAGAWAGVDARPDAGADAEAEAARARGAAGQPDEEGLIITSDWRVIPSSCGARGGGAVGGGSEMAALSQDAVCGPRRSSSSGGSSESSESSSSSEIKSSTADPPRAAAAAAPAVANQQSLPQPPPSALDPKPLQQRSAAAGGMAGSLGAQMPPARGPSPAKPRAAWGGAPSPDRRQPGMQRLRAAVAAGRQEIEERSAQASPAGSRPGSAAVQQRGAGAALAAQPPAQPAPGSRPGTAGVGGPSLRPRSAAAGQQRGHAAQQQPALPPLPPLGPLLAGVPEGASQEEVQADLGRALLALQRQRDHAAALAAQLYSQASARRGSTSAGNSRPGSAAAGAARGGGGSGASAAASASASAAAASAAASAGVSKSEEPDLLPLAAAALTAPLPPGWTVHLDCDGAEYFARASDGAAQYEHPSDADFRRRAAEARAARRGGG
ncbi:hypothetical protein Rsub_12796 [Raphidocelis subcapitata]|uniref:WW domain-containing protein n=1 Tax=Raphidocelis subcapitata TaxID=307507 RepID=A0A2V0PJR9_9CHLO|nr:hypothetical protein Rsub_12796 [Raphidocelis subcapitata]|eukprot:GBG00052.1 hypothetical protein Rsub_12796 [Raphidocelis subcapitata]